MEGYVRVGVGGKYGRVCESEVWEGVRGCGGEVWEGV